MAKRERKPPRRQTEVDQKHRVRQPDSEPSSERFHALKPDVFPTTETPFLPPLDEHAALLDAAGDDTRRSDLATYLQQTYGNRYVQRLIGSRAVQAKLTVNAPGDVYEQEADTVADAVASAGVTQLQRQPEEEEEVQAKPVDSVQRQGAEEEEELQAKPAGSQPALVADDLETRINAAKGSGQPLSDSVREPMAHALGADLGDVHVHTDPEADALNRQLSARAFTTGSDVFFRQGAFDPVSANGRELIAHELTHVVQQTGGATGAPPTPSSLHRSDDVVQRELLPVQYRMLGTTREEYNDFAPDVRAEVEELVGNSRWVAAQRALARARAAVQPPPSVGPVPQVQQPPAQQGLPAKQGPNTTPPRVPPRPGKIGGAQPQPPVSIPQVQQPPAQQVVNKPPPPKPPRPIYREVSFNPKQIPADGVTTTQASVKTVPTSRAVTWSLEGNTYGATISPAGLITPGKGIADQEKAQVRVKATDVREPVVSNTGELTLMEPKYYQAVQDYDAFTAKTYKFQNFQTGVQGLFDMEYQPLAKLAAVTLKVKFEIKDDPKKNDSLFDDLQRKLDYPYYREQFSDIVTDAWSKRYQFRNIREPQSVWGKLNPVTVPVRVQQVKAGEQFLIKLDLTQEKGAAVARPKKGSRYARLYKGSLAEKQGHFQKQVLQGENDRIKSISPGASPGSPAIEFGSGSKKVSEADKGRLRFMATYLRGISVPPLELEIEGHSSSGDETNLLRMVFGGLTGAKNAISQQRAEAVRDEIKSAGGVGTTHKLSTADAGRTGASKVLIRPQIQAGFTNTYVTVAHEVGHMFGLADEYFGPKTAYGHHKLVKKAFGLKYADTLVSAPVDVGKQGEFADVMATGQDVRMHNYVTFWEALYQTTSQKATVPAIKFGEADWKFVGYSG